MNDQEFQTRGFLDLQGDLDYEQCQTDPIHQTTRIQPHGTFIAISPGGDRIYAAAENVQEFLDLELKDLLHASPKVLFGRNINQKIESFIERDNQEKKHLVLHRETGQLSGTLIPLNSGVGLELERSSLSDETAQEMMQNMTDRLFELARHRRQKDLLQTTTTAIKAITGMDRVLIYSFGEKGHGKVIAEQREEDLNSYLNHHFPATDIPEPARRLYRINRIRYIPNVHDDPVLVSFDDSGASPDSLDLTHASLRNVPEVHREYMKNMGVTSSLSVSLIVRGELWGLITAHGMEPTELGWAQRTISQIVGQITSRQIRQLETRKREQQQDRIEKMKTNVQGPLDDYRDFFEELRQNQSTLFSLMDASHFYIELFEENLFLSRDHDIELPEALLKAIRKTLENHRFLKVNSIVNELDESWQHSEEISGFMAVRMGSPDSFVVWFRPEIVNRRKWGGDPREAAKVDDDGNINPRESFDEWTQIISDSCRRWSDLDAMTARKTVRMFESLVLRVQNNRYKTLNKKLTQLATTDDLTGLPNRRTLINRLNTEVKRASRYGPDLAFAILDLDHFKDVNDQYGHPKGDEVLERFADHLEEQTRESDFTARFGGEEFAVIFPESSLEEAKNVGNRLRSRATELPFEADGEPFKISCSIGLTTLLEDEPDIDQLIKRADVALYEAKKDGRNCLRTKRTNENLDMDPAETSTSDL